MPAFSSPIDCTPWVTGGLWPAELSTVTAETATLAEHLKADLQRISHAANDELKLLKRSGMTDASRQAAEARVIDEARARAVRRVESTMRYLHAMRSGAQAPVTPPPRLEPHGADLERTQVLPAIREAKPVAEPPMRLDPEATPRPEGRRRRESAIELVADPGTPQAPSQRAHADRTADVSHLGETQVIPVVRDEPDSPVPVQPAPEPAPDQADSGRHHAVVDEAVTGMAEPQVVRQERVVDPTATAATPAVAGSGRPSATTAQPGDEKRRFATSLDSERLNRLLEFVVRQEPRLNWAIGDRGDGTTVLVTDLAHGWIPSGITLPAGVRLLEPERRSGRVAALIGETARVVTYAPGDSLHRSVDFTATRSSMEPRTLPAIDDLASVLSAATRGRDDLPKIAPRLAEAAATGTVVVDQEVDVLRVHLDTARYQLLVQYPNVNPGLLLKCLLMAATEGIASGDAVSANYHLAWYQKLAG